MKCILILLLGLTAAFAEASTETGDAAWDAAVAEDTPLLAGVGLWTFMISAVRVRGARSSG